MKEKSEGRELLRCKEIDQSKLFVASFLRFFLFKKSLLRLAAAKSLAAANVIFLPSLCLNFVTFFKIKYVENIQADS